MPTKRNPRSAVVTQPPVPTIIEFLLDETGSMSSIKAATIGGFNDFLNEQRVQEGLCLLTLTKFDTDGQRTPYTDLDLNMVPELTTNTFHPNASTNLRDSIMARIANVEGRVALWDIAPRVLFIVMTDGDDNASRTTTDETRAAIMAATARGWTMVYLGAHERAKLAANQLGFAEGNVKSFEGARMQETMHDLSAATKAYRATATATEASETYFSAR